MLGSIQHFLGVGLANFLVQKGGLLERESLIEGGLKSESTVFLWGMKLFDISMTCFCPVPVKLNDCSPASSLLQHNVIELYAAIGTDYSCYQRQHITTDLNM